MEAKEKVDSYDDRSVAGMLDVIQLTYLYLPCRLVKGDVSYSHLKCKSSIMYVNWTHKVIAQLEFFTVSISLLFQNFYTTVCN